MHLRQHVLICTFSFLPLLPQSIQAQSANGNTQEVQIQTQELLKKDIPVPSKSVKPKSEEEKEWDKEFGRLFILERPKPWSITPYSSTLGFWTSNARLDHAGERDDWVLVQRQGVNLHYRIDEHWHISTRYAFELIRYNDNVDLDTDAHIAELSINRRLPWNWNLTIGDRGTWLDSPHRNTEVYREHHPHVILTQTHSYLDNHLYWFYGFQYNRKFTHPVTFDRNEYVVFTGISYDWTPQLVSQFILRQNWQFYDFRGPAQPVNGRQEWISRGILQTVWQPLSWLQLTGFASTAYDNSINSTHDYEVANVGAEVRLFWKF